MRGLALYYLGVITVFASTVVRECDSLNFPIQDCTTHKMDILFLYYSPVSHIIQTETADQFIQILLSYSSNITPQVMFAEVCDKFTDHNPNVNVTSWHFHSSGRPAPYGNNDTLMLREKYMTVKERVESKVKFIHRLFSEMGGVRTNVTRVAVVFLNGLGLSREDSRKVARTFQKQSTDIKMLSVVLGGKFVKQMVHISDTILMPVESSYLYMHILNLAICHQCMRGWWRLEHKDGADHLSCYLMLNSGTVSSLTTSSNCFYGKGAVLATVESQREMSWLRPKLITYIKAHTNISHNANTSSQTPVHIGLTRDSTSVANRFKWAFSLPIQYRPLIDYSWLPGMPHGGSNSGCAVWQFTWGTNTSGVKNESSHKDGVVDGWVDVECRAEISSFSLCEVVLPRRAGDMELLRVNPATNQSLSQALARGNLLVVDGNIVSISVHVLTINNLASLHEAQINFPVFDCKLGADNLQYISYLFVCDSVDQCSNRRDETICGAVPQEDRAVGYPKVNNCAGVYCCDSSCLPLRWVNDEEIDCNVCSSSTENKGNDESQVFSKYLAQNRTCAFIYGPETCVPESFLNNGHVDLIGEDGPLDETIGKLKPADTCYNILGQRIWAPRCVYVTDKYGAILGCRNMSHLEDCGTFDCSEGYFKCPNTYCIPQHYVRDAKPDCPTGEEEQSDAIETCTGNFACWDSEVCLHPDLVCDGHPDCPHKDDEFDCHINCTLGFRCVSGTITVSDYNVPLFAPDLDFTIDAKTRFLNMSGVDLSGSHFYFLSYSKNLIVVIWSKCRLGEFPDPCSSCLSTVQDLDMSYNMLKILDGREIGAPFENIRNLNLSYNTELVSLRYFQLRLLESLDLSHTGLVEVDESFLIELPNLKYLNLSYSSLSQFSRATSLGKVSLQILDLRGVQLYNFDTDYFNGLIIGQSLYTDIFELCCPQIMGPNIPFYACHAPQVAISSCVDLIRVPIQRSLLWVVAVLAVLGNTTVIVYRVIWDRSVLKTGYGLFVTNLGISDFIMGVYLLIIAGADQHYSGNYVLFDKTWRESIACRTAGFLATLSCETSAFFVFLITVDRFLVMKFPFGQKQFSQKSKVVSLLSAWLIAFFLAVAPIVFQLDIYTSNAVCLGLPLTTRQVNGWQFSFAVFVVINFILCLVNACGQRAIFQAISENRMSGSDSVMPSRRASDILVAKQLCLIAMSNFLCWFPVGLVGLLSLSGHEISNDVYAWITVIVLPINSAANPFLYTIPVIMAKWETFKKHGAKSRPVSCSEQSKTDSASIKKSTQKSS